ncbi:MAG: sialidase family protein [Verrucomicrobiales bacterium]
MKFLTALFVLLVPAITSAESKYEGELAPFLSGGPKFEIQQVFEGGRFPNLAVATDGTVLAVFGKDGVRLRRSEDGGESWGDEIVIAKAGFMGGGVTVDEGSGDILAFIETSHPPAPLEIYRSGDHGKTWQVQEGTEIKPDKQGHVPSMHMNDHGITLRHGDKNGRLVRPTRWYGKRNSREEWPTHYTNAIFSDDGGTTWQASEPFPEMGTGEACIVELSDGSLYYNSRVHWDKRPNFTRRREARSDDAGETWDDFRIVEILPDGQQNRSYGCMGGLTRLAVAGRDILLFSNLETPNSTRENGTVWASFDGGKTWPVKRLANAGPSGYSSMNSGRPGTASEGWIYLMPEAGGAKVARFNLSWILAGDATGDGDVPGWVK